MPQYMSDGRLVPAHPDPLSQGEYLCTVAQIFNLLYRRFVIGRTLLAGDISQVKNLRYGRLQVCATGAANAPNTYQGASLGESAVGGNKMLRSPRTDLHPS